MNFESYRAKLLSKPMPFDLDCIVWMQSDWRTLTGTFAVLGCMAQYSNALVLIVGHDDGLVDVAAGRMMRGGAPSTSQMYQVVANGGLAESRLADVEVKSDCPNTLEQAKAFADFLVVQDCRSALVFAPHYHIPRASLTFAREGIDIDLFWRSFPGTISDDDDELEKLKILRYGLAEQV